MRQLTFLFSLFIFCNQLIADPAGGARRCQGQTCVNGGSGGYCITSQDCITPRCNPKTRACEKGGTGMPCEGNESVCYENGCLDGQCVPGGTGISCNNYSDCNLEKKRCDLYGACVFGGSGIPCGPGITCPTKVCASEKVCEDGPATGPFSKTCETAEDCDPLTYKFCRADGTCVRGLPPSGSGTAHSCLGPNDCNFKSCDFRGRCLIGNFGHLCTGDLSNNDCKSERKVCENSECKLGGVGSASCNGPENCNHKACVKEKGAFGGNTFQCKEVPSPGENGCETYSDCPEEEDPILPNVGNQNLGLPIPKVQPAPKVLPGAAIKILKTKMYQATIGASTAPVTVAVFQDLKCGMCKKAGKEVLPNLIKEYVDTGKVKVQFFEFPLGNAKIENELANAALCAHEQKKYVSYLNKLYEDMKTTKVEDVSIYAKELGLDTKAFNKCVSQNSHMKDIKKHVEVGKKLFVNGTPTFFVNGKEMRGAKPYDLFKVAIEKELSQNRRRFTKELTTGAKSEVQDKVAKEK